MQITRRSLLSLASAVTLSPAFAGVAHADAPDPNAAFGPRTLGASSAPVKAIEYFSITCSHCAHFATATMPQVKPQLIDTGKLEIIYKDFPLDRVALMAAQVARSLPAEQYYPFIERLFASQADWAFTPGINYTESIYKYAAQAGMSRADYNAALANGKLRAFILNGKQEAKQMYHVRGTPSFIINGTLYPGAVAYPVFAARVAQATGNAKG